MSAIDYLQFVLALVLVLALIWGIAWVMKRWQPGLVSNFKTANGNRLSVVEVKGIDARRKLALIRRDDVEHLILLSQNADTVIETGIAPPAFRDNLEVDTGNDTPGTQQEQDS